MRRTADPRRGFTLTEVMISLVILTMGICAVAAVLPVGLKQQSLTRDKIIASAMAVYLMDLAYNQPLPLWLRTPGPVYPNYPLSSGAANPALTSPAAAANLSQALYPPESFRSGSPSLSATKRFSKSSYPALEPESKIHAPDFERIVATWQWGICTVPEAISSRLRSAGGELEEILKNGGQLYYFGALEPRATDVTNSAAFYSNNAAFNPQSGHPLQRPVALPKEIQNIVFAVRGYAQKNETITFTDGQYPQVSAPGAFKPADRCRQLIFWSVNWRNYQDAETAQTPSVDVARYPTFTNTDWSPSPSVAALKILDVVDPQDPALMSPDRFHMFTTDQSAVKNGTSVKTKKSISAEQQNDPTAVGGFGADTNGNDRLDRGAIAIGSPMTAFEVGRYNFYDPVVWLTINQQAYEVLP